MYDTSGRKLYRFIFVDRPAFCVHERKDALYIGVKLHGLPSRQPGGNRPGTRWKGKQHSRLAGGFRRSVLRRGRRRQMAVHDRNVYYQLAGPGNPLGHPNTPAARARSTWRSSAISAPSPGKTSSWRAITPSTGIKSSRETLIVYLRMNVYSTQIPVLKLLLSFYRSLRLYMAIQMDLDR